MIQLKKVVGGPGGIGRRMKRRTFKLQRSLVHEKVPIEELKSNEVWNLHV